MRKPGGRKASRSQHEGVLSPETFGQFSSSPLDDRDLDILSVARDRPSTLLSMSDRTNIPFVECLLRARNLQQMGLLRKLSDTCNADGLYLYVAEERPI